MLPLPPIGVSDRARATRESCACLPAKGHADRLRNGDQVMGLSDVCGDELWQALREDAVPAGRIPTYEFARGELDADWARAPEEISAETAPICDPACCCVQVGTPKV